MEPTLQRRHFRVSLSSGIAALIWSWTVGSPAAACDGDMPTSESMIEVGAVAGAPVPDAINEPPVGGVVLDGTDIIGPGIAPARIGTDGSDKTAAVSRFMSASVMPAPSGSF